VDWWTRHSKLKTQIAGKIFSTGSLGFIPR